MKRYVLAVTGATASLIGLRLLEALLKECEVHLILSGTAISIICDEAGAGYSELTKENLLVYLDSKYRGKAGSFGENLTLYDEKDLWAPVSSGSFNTDGMLVAPCSMKTLSAIANGYAEGLIERAADVTIKEGRQLLLAPRETPLSSIHLENMLKLSRIGVRIVPPMLSLYHRPASVDDMVDFAAGKILDQISFGHTLYKRWKS